MRNFKNVLLAALFFVTATVLGQTKLSGVVVDEMGEPLPGASVLLKGTGNGTSTDFDGKFILKSKSNSGAVVISFVGYVKKEVAFSTSNLGTIKLDPSNVLDEVVVVGIGVVDVANSRKTPTAVSTIKAAEIQRKIGTQDVTMVLVNSPSIYVGGQSGGFGESRISVRGFDQTNTAFLLNGQPINGMEDGKMYWSNWSGINDVASAVQVQRGLGASKLAISSIGGTTNFITKTTDKKEGGMFYAGIANDRYYKTTLAYNSGKNEKGFGVSAILSTWQGDGYNDGTRGEGQTYFLSFGYTPNDKHNFNFLITGAPQSHDQNFSKKISDYLTYGKRYNNNWGTFNGKYKTERRNFYHKPVMNFNWDWKINENAKLATVVYGSFGRGGGTGGRGTGKEYKDGQIDYDAIYAKNQSIDGGKGINYGNDSYVTRASINLHNWFGLVTNFEAKLRKNVTFNIGADLRTYYGEHFRVVSDYHGLSSWQEAVTLKDPKNGHGRLLGESKYGGVYKNVVVNEQYNPAPWSSTFENYAKNQRIAYSNDERISYGGVFTQLEYADDRYSAFVQAALSKQAHQRFDDYQYADESLINGTSPFWTGVELPEGTEPHRESEKVSNLGYNLKVGGSIKVNENNKIYVNAGVYSRQPFHDNIYLNYTNALNPFTKNEKILGLEAGYKFKSRKFNANINLYRTSWKDRITSSSSIVDDVLTYKTNFGVEQLHSGAELDFVYKPIEKLRVKGFASIGDWEYKGDATTQVTDENQVVKSIEKENIDGGKVGDAAQTTFGLGVDYKVIKDLSVDVDFRHYANLYANVGAVKENLELPAYSLVDLGVSYNVDLGIESIKAFNLRLNVNNLFNEEYFSDLRTNIKTTDLVDSKDPSKGTYASNGQVYKGIATRNQGYFGYGTTWNFGVRINF